MIKKLKSRIKKAKNVLIISHKSPDGDSIGSILGLGLSLKKHYDNIEIAINDIVPERFNFLRTEEIGFVDSTEKYDLVLMLDCGDYFRTGLEANKSKIVNIDHHITNPSFGDINIVNTEASSTSEIVFDILTEMKINIDIDAAEALYTGISSDTGSFKYSSTTKHTHEVAGKLFEIGIDRDTIVNHLYHSQKLKSVYLLKEAISNMEILYDGKIAFLDITEEIYEKSGADPKESDALVEFLRDIDGVEVSITLKTVDSGIKGSLRSKNLADVSKVASYFGGGGHTKASGFTSEMDRKDLKAKLIELIEKGIEA